LHSYFLKKIFNYDLRVGNEKDFNNIKYIDMPSGKKRKRHKMSTHKRKKRLRKNRHKKKK